MIHTENRIDIHAPPDVVFALAANVSGWPELLAHYRFVEVMERDQAARRNVVRMGARRSFIPVSWTAVQECTPEAGTIAYRHVRGITRGMQVEWRIAKTGRGCAVSILHDLARPQGLLRLPFAQWVAGRLFVEAIAQRTLAGLRARAESPAFDGAGREEQSL